MSKATIVRLSRCPFEADGQGSQGSPKPFSSQWLKVKGIYGIIVITSHVIINDGGNYGQKVLEFDKNSPICRVIWRHAHKTAVSDHI